MLLFVGLGNPGPDHAGNRHNVGFMAVDEIVRRHSFGPWRSRFHGLLSEGRLADRRVLALKPLTYMNDSGRSVGAAARYYKIAPEDIVVFHDELDLAGGRMRVKVGGGHAGHNGLRSLHAHIGPDYRRVRLGIGHPGDKRRVQRWVLSDFAKAEISGRDRLIEAVAEAAPLLAAGEDSRFASRVALLVNPPKARPAARRDRAAPTAEGDPGPETREPRDGEADGL